MYFMISLPSGLLDSKANDGTWIVKVKGNTLAEILNYYVEYLPEVKQISWDNETAQIKVELYEP